MMTLLYSLLVILIIIAVVNGIYGSLYKVVNMPSTPQTRRHIIDAITEKAGYDHDLVIYELGSGWGGLCRKMANAFPKADIRGFEISPVPFLFSWFIGLLDFRGRYAIRRQNIFHTDITDADIIVCYLSPYHMQRFERELMPDMKEGSRLYSQGFPLTHKEADKVIDVPYSLEKRIFCYIIKAD